MCIKLPHLFTRVCRCEESGEAHCHKHMCKGRKRTHRKTLRFSASASARNTAQAKSRKHTQTQAAERQITKHRYRQTEDRQTVRQTDRPSKTQAKSKRKLKRNSQTTGIDYINISVQREVGGGRGGDRGQVIPSSNSVGRGDL
jgi:hypothetical protein